MNHSLNQHLTYQQWLSDRGQPAPRPQGCKVCGYLRQPMPTRLIVYDTLTDREKELLDSQVLPDGFGTVSIYPCSTNDGRICVDQWQDWQQVQLVVFLGNPSASLVIGEQRFAQQQGKISKLTDNISYCLTFHPRDLLRYRDNAACWQRDLKNSAKVSE